MRKLYFFLNYCVSGFLLFSGILVWSASGFTESIALFALAMPFFPPAIRYAEAKIGQPFTLWERIGLFILIILLSPNLRSLISFPDSQNLHSLIAEKSGIESISNNTSATSEKDKTEAPNPIGSVQKWVYRNSESKMGEKIKSASILSLNQVGFGFPYEGSQNAYLTLRIHPRHGNDVIFGLHKAQFLCGLDGCEITVRFDEGKPQVYSASEPNDHSTNLIFIHNYKGFVTKLKNAKKVYIESTFYQEGNQVFEFDVDGLKW